MGEGYSTSLKFGSREEKVRINGSLTLSCLAKGFPEPKVTWFKDGQVSVSPYQAVHLLKLLTSVFNGQGLVSIGLYWQQIEITTTSKGFYLHKPSTRILCH